MFKFWSWKYNHFHSNKIKHCYYLKIRKYFYLGKEWEKKQTLSVNQVKTASGVWLLQCLEWTCTVSICTKVQAWLSVEMQSNFVSGWWYRTRDTHKGCAVFCNCEKIRCYCKADQRHRQHLLVSQVLLRWASMCTTKHATWALAFQTHALISLTQITNCNPDNLTEVKKAWFHSSCTGWDSTEALPQIELPAFSRNVFLLNFQDLQLIYTVHKFSVIYVFSEG